MEVVLGNVPPAWRLVVSCDATVSLPVRIVDHVDAMETGTSVFITVDWNVLSPSDPPTTAPSTFSMKGI